MKRNIITAIFIWVCFLLQTTVFHKFEFNDIIPNLMIIITAAFGFMRGQNNGLLVGFFCGFLMDIFYGSTLGFYALIYMFIGYLNGFFKVIFYPEDIKLPLFLITFSDITYGLVIYILKYLLRGKFHFGFYFSKIILPEAIYTILVTVILYPIIFLINNKLEEREKENAKKFV